MILCRLCTPLDEHGKPNLDEHGNFCLTDAKGKPLKGLKQIGKAKYNLNGIDYERIYRCLDCNARWRQVGKLGQNPGYRDEPMLRIVK